MQERVAVVTFKGQEPIALYGVEPLHLTTQLNRPDVPAWLSLLGRHYSTIPCCYSEILSVRWTGATVVTALGRKFDERFKRGRNDNARKRAAHGSTMLSDGPSTHFIACDSLRRRRRPP